jgi:Tfp pilus assembly protein PilO
MALLPQDRRGQILLMLTVAAAVAAWVVWQGNPIPPKLMGWAEMRDSIKEADSVALDLEQKVAKVKRDVRMGTDMELDARLERYRASLALIRQLVPTTTQVADLLDGVSTRARVRGTAIAEFNMQPPESSFPYDKVRGRVRLTGTFDQIAETLADIGSLDQVVAPYDLEIQPVASGGGADTTRQRGLLDARFMILTYVRVAPNAVVPGAAAPAGAQTPAPAQTPARAPATPSGGAPHE